MCAVSIFIRIIVAGTLFLPWFVIQPLREHPFAVHSAVSAAPADRESLNPLQLEEEWSTVRRQESALALHSAWRYRFVPITTINEGEPSCGISSL